MSTLKVGPNQQQPTLLLTSQQATTTSADIFYTMALIAYSKLVKQQPELKHEGELVMSSENKDINRNTLNKQSNRELSETLVRFMLKISPFFMV
jgi:Na+/citrate or Na+/malate symporter